MNYYFGFIPSAKLSAMIEECIVLAASNNAPKPFYMYRDDITLTLGDELIDNALMTLVKVMEPPSRKQTAEKMVNMIKSTQNTLMRQVLGKASNEEALKSLPFLQKLAHMGAGNTPRVGVIIDSEVTANTKTVFAKLINDNQDNDAIRKELIGAFKTLTEQVTRGILGDFIKTLPIGMFKRTTADLAIVAIIKAVNMGASQILPGLNTDELTRMVKHFDQFIYQPNA